MKLESASCVEVPPFDVDKFFAKLSVLYPDVDIELDYECDQFALLLESTFVALDQDRPNQDRVDYCSLAHRLIATYRSPAALSKAGADGIAKFMPTESIGTASVIAQVCAEFAKYQQDLDYMLDAVADTIPTLPQIFRNKLQERALFKLLIATVLSARCTDVAVNKALPKLFADGDSPYVLLSLGEEEVARRISTIGLYKNKAKFIIGICSSIVSTGSVPTTQEGLERLPGVGRKTANVVLNAALGAPVFPVDTHVFRVCNRTGLAVGKTPLSVERILSAHVPAKWARKASQLLILHGRYVCKSQKPRCAECPVNKFCKHYLTVTSVQSNK